MPVHSELRQPRSSSSSANSRRTSLLGRAGTLPRLLQPRLDRVAVYAAVLEVELVRELLDRHDLVAGHDPQRHRLLPPRVELACVRLGERAVGRVERAAVLERLPFALLAEDLPDAVGHRGATPPARARRATPSS